MRSATLAHLVAGGRRAEVEVLADHVAHDPLEVDLGARGVGGHGAVAQHDGVVGDLQRLLEVVRDVDDGDAPRLQVADDLEEHLDLGGGEGRGGLVHDEDAAVDRQRAGDLDDLLLAEAELLDRGARVDVLLELGHERAGLALLLGEVDAAAAGDLAAHEDVVADAEVGRERELLVDDGDAGVARLGGGGEGDGPAVEDDLARGRAG